jgi:hypothetical protein
MNVRAEAITDVINAMTAVTRTAQGDAYGDLIVPSTRLHELQDTVGRLRIAVGLESTTPAPPVGVVHTIVNERGDDFLLPDGWDADHNRGPGCAAAVRTLVGPYGNDWEMELSPQGTMDLPTVADTDDGTPWVVTASRQDDHGRVYELDSMFETEPLLAGDVFPTGDVETWVLTQITDRKVTRYN